MFYVVGVSYTGFRLKKKKKKDVLNFLLDYSSLSAILPLMKNTLPEILTPIYTIFYCVKNITGNNQYTLERALTQSEKKSLDNDSSIRFPSYFTEVTFKNKDKAIEKAESVLERSDISSVSVVHYGFEERGFRPKDKNLGVIFKKDKE